MLFPAVRRSLLFCQFGDYSDKPVSTTKTFPVRAEFVDAAAAQDEFSTFCGFECFRSGFTVEDADYFAAAVGAFAGLAAHVGDVVGFLAHGAWFHKGTKK